MKHIFISSTFRDMQAERDLVQERVLPELKEKARKYGENVGVIDLRWGVDTSELETEEGSRKVLSVCLDEIERSHPYMLIFVGERYGWIPDAKMIQNAVEEKADKIILDDFEKSITALEIEFGALSEYYGELDKCVVCFRSPLAHLISDEEERKIYLETNPNAVKKLQTLQERMKKLLGGRVIEYTADWNEKEKLFENFRTVNGEALEDAISNAYLTMFQKNWEDCANLTWQQKEQLEVQALMESKLKSFRGRKALIEQYIQQIEKTNVLILQGNVGSGKTSILCKIMQKLENDDKKVFRFISGNSARSSSAFDLLKQMVWFLEELLEVREHFKADDSEYHFENKKQEKSSKYKEWMKRMELLCEQIPSELSVYFCIDALDQLEQDEHVKKMDFIPFERENIHIIATCTPEFQLPVAFETPKRFVEKVPLLSVDDAMEVIAGLSAGSYKTVYESIKSVMLEKADAGNPLYLSFLMQRLNMMNQEELRNAVNEQEIIEMGVQIVKNIPEKLESAAVHVLDGAIRRLTDTPKALKEIQNLLAVSRNGLRVEDLKNMVEADGNIYQTLDMTRLMKYLEDFYVLYSDGRIDFGHKIIRKGLREKLRNEKIYQQKILNYLKKLPEEDSLRNREGMYFARELDDLEFGEELLIEARKEGKKELLRAIADEAVKDQGDFYCRIIRNVTAAHDENRTAYMRAFFLENFDELLDSSEAEQQTIGKILHEVECLCRESYEKSQALWNLRPLAICWGKLGSYYKSQGDYKNAEVYYKKYVWGIEQSNQETGTTMSFESLSNANMKLGDLYETKGLYKEAKESFEKALSYSEHGYEKSRWLSSYSLIAKANGKLANIYMMLGDYEESEKYWLSFHENSKRLYEEAGDSALWYLMASNDGLGIICEEKKQYAKAEANYREALEYGKRRYEKFKDLGSLSDLASLRRKVGVICEKQRRFKEAEVLYFEALQNSKQLHEKQNNVHSLHELGLSTEYLGLLYDAQEQYEKAAEYYVTYLQYNEELYTQLKDLKSLKRLAIAKGHMGYVCEMQERYNEAEKYYGESLEHYEYIYQKTKNISSLRDLAVGNERMGCVYETEENYIEAEKYFANELKYSRELYQKTNSLKDIHMMAIACSNLAGISRTYQKYESAEQYYKEGMGYYEQIHMKENSINSLESLSICLENMGSLYRMQKLYEEAVQCFRKSIGYSEEIAARIRDEYSLKDLALGYEKIGNTFAEIKNLSDAKESYEKALTLSNEIYELHGTDTNKRRIERISEKLDELNKAEIRKESEEIETKPETLFSKLFRRIKKNP